MIDLTDVSLCCVDTRYPALALQAMQRCMASLRFREALLFTDLRQPVEAGPGIRLVDCRIDSIGAYSGFMLRELAPHVSSSHVLVVQWDGFVWHPDAWDPAFLQYDYIGPRWHDAPSAALSVGNGGFSLRSQRLLQALQDPAFEPQHPEDVCICRTYRDALEQRHGIRFAPPEVADRFGFERTPPRGRPFGFHGLMNLHRVLPGPELHRFLADLPARLAGSLDAHDLCAALLDEGDLAGAGLLLDKRRQLGMRDRRTLRLRLRRWMASRRR